VIFDIYAEGLATWFSRSLLIAHGHDWSPWEQYYGTPDSSYYGPTYKLICALEAVVSREQLRTLFGFVERIGSKPSIMATRWIDQLPDHLRGPAVEAIRDATQSIEQVLPADFSFDRPVDHRENAP
jgi:hypothetical protein